MGLRRTRRTLPLNAEINVVSLIDVMMLLMIIFMITAPLLTGSVDVKLPKANVRATPVQSPLMLSVQRDGILLVDNVRMSREEFRANMSTFVAQAKDKTVYLKGDEGAPYGDVVQILALLREGGVSNVSLVAEPTASQP
jgi:biopolymer transport protein TolR